MKHMKHIRKVASGRPGLSACPILVLGLATGAVADASGADHEEQQAPTAAPIHQLRDGQALSRAVMHGAPPADWSVINCSDDGSPGTLRNLVSLALSGDVIDMSACASINLNSVIQISQSSLTLVGSEAPRTSFDAASADAFDFGVIWHNGAGLLTLDNIRLHQGRMNGSFSTPGLGACIRSMGSVLLRFSTVFDCIATNPNGDALGGAIYAATSVNIQDSEVFNSKAIAHGDPGVRAAGGAAYTPGLLTVYRTSIRYNAAVSDDFSWGGGLWAGDGAIVGRSEISRNSAESSGGMVVLSDALSLLPIRIESSTISGNWSNGPYPAAGAWLHASDGPVTLANNTITDNFIVFGDGDNDGAGLAIGPGASVIELTNNIISGNYNEIVLPPDTLKIPSDFDPGNGATVTGSHNLFGTIDPGFSSIPVDTIHQNWTPLGPLSSNGTSTPAWSHALGTGSWAFNRGWSDLTIDQRIFPREVGAGVDIGAIESDALFIGRFEDPPTSFCGLARSRGDCLSFPNPSLLP